MNNKIFKQEFKGYRRYQNRGGIPKVSGVYCVYRGVYNPKDDTVSLKSLLYIGKAEDINDRLQNHEKLTKWESCLISGEEIIFSYTELPNSDIDRFEAAMIFGHKPPINKDFVNNFPFDTTEIYTSGRNALLKNHFTVCKTSDLVHY